MTHRPRTRSALLLLVLILAGIGVAVWWVDDGEPEPRPDRPLEEAAADPEGARKVARHPTRERPKRPGPSSQGGASSTRFPDAPAQQGPAPARPLGTVHGVVRAAAGLQPVADCQVDAYHVTGERLGRTLTDDAGVYELEGLPVAQPLVLRFSAMGFVPGLCCDLELAAATAAEKSVDLVQGPALGVRVLLAQDGAGGGESRPHPAVEVFLVRGGEPVASATTDAEGSCTLHAPGYGTFGLRLRGDDIAPTPDEPVSILAGRGAEVLTRTVHAGGTLRVTVLRPDGSPDEGASVIVSSAGLEPETGFTNADGETRIDRVPPRLPLEVTAVATGGYAAQQVVQVADREETHVTLELAPPGSVSGGIVARGDLDIAGVELQIGELVVTADERGRFAVPLVPPGSHAVRILQTDLRPYRDLGTVEVVGGHEATLSIEVEAAPIVDVAGTVVDLAGRGVLGAVVVAHPGEVTAVTDRRGDFALEGLVEGEDVRLALRGAGHVIVSTGPGIDVPLTPRPLTPRVGIVVARSDPGPPPGEVRALPTGAPEVGSGSGFRAEVTGRLVTPSGSSASGIQVRCRRSTTRTREDGTFTIRNVAFVAGAPPPMVVVIPGAGLLLPTQVEARVPAPGEAVSGLGTIQLEVRPHAVIDVRGSRDAFGAPLRRFWYASAQPDEFLGGRRGLLQPIPCFSYDGTWIHLPPATASSRCVTLFAVDTGHGIVTAHDAWIVSADTRAVLRPMSVRSPTRLEVRVPRGYRTGWLRLRQASHGSSASFVKALGEVVFGDLAETDPFRELATGAGFAERIGKQRVFHVEDLAPGTWKLELVPPRGSQRATLEREVDLSRKSSVDFN